MTNPGVQNRRELKTRARAWPRALARALGAIGITPNMVSVMSVVFAVLAWWAYQRIATDSGRIYYIIAAAGIQLRLLCNLLDGLLAIEGGLKTKTGELYNEVPDRIADVLILIGAGYAAREVPYATMLGWSCAVVAVLTAYVRLLGGSLGFTQDFVGPMAKQHRMFVLTLATLIAALEITLSGQSLAIAIALALIFVGSVFTFIRRLSRIARQLRAR